MDDVLHGTTSDLIVSDFLKMSSELNLTANGSLLEDNPFYDIEDEDSYTYGTKLHRHIFEWIFVIVQLMKITIWVLGLASDIYIIVIFSKFKNLRNRTNNFILQYVVFNILYLVLSNIIFIIWELSHGHYSFEGYCLISNFDHLTITLSFYVLTFMAIDWYVLNYHSSLYKRYPRSFKHGYLFLYLFALPKWITTSTFCFLDRELLDKVKFHLEGFSYVLCVITIIGIAVLKSKNLTLSEAYKTEYAFSIPKIVLLCSVGVFITKIVYLNIEENMSIWSLQLIYLFEYIGEIIFLSAPIAVVCQLTSVHKYFKSAYIKCCKKKRVKNYSDDNLDGDSDYEVQSAKVSYQRNSEEVTI